MKKAILLSAAVVASLGAFAQTDITPANYKIEDGAKLPFSPNHVPTNINISNDVWNTVNGDQYWNDGLIVLSSGAGVDMNPRLDVIADANYLDLKGEVGKVYCWIGAKSKVDKGDESPVGAGGLDTFAPDNETWSKLKKVQGSLTGYCLNIFLDPNTPYNGFVRCEIIFNVHDTDTEGNALNMVAPVNIENTGKSTWPGKGEYMENVNGNCIVSADSFLNDETGEWDPTKWCKLTFDFTVTSPDSDGKKYTPMRIKFFPQNGAASDDQAWFLKSIKFTHYDSGTPEYFGNRTPEFITLNPDLENATFTSMNPTAIEGIDAADVNAPVEYYNLQGQKVANPENGIFIRKQGKSATKVVM